MKVLLDTHFLVWILLRSDRLARSEWLGELRPWGVSPVSLLEIQFLGEVGRLEVETRQLVAMLQHDRRLVVDEPPLLALTERAIGLGWTRDPFDRLLVAHSLLRRLPLVTLDRCIREHHSLVLPEQAPEPPPAAARPGHEEGSPTTARRSRRR